MAAAKPEPLGPRRSKRDLVLETAARRLNAHGVSQTALTDIAAELGLTRAALYYYVEDRDDLVFQCYRRACETMARDLDAAAKPPDPGLQRISTFVDLALDAERPEPAALAEVAALPAPQRETIEALHNGNLARLIDLIEAGQADGSVRSGHPLVIAQAIVGMISWIPLAPRWTGEPEANFRASAKAGALTLVTDGVAADPRVAMAFAPLDIAILRPARGNLFDRETAAALKLEELLRAASRLFNQKGVEATSIDEIAAAVGATKGAVYHYLADKPDLVARCFRRAFGLSDRILQAVELSGGKTIHRVMAGAALLIQANLDDEFCPLAPLVGVEALPSDAQAEIRDRIGSLEHGYPQVAAEGRADGTVRDVDLTGAAVAMAGVFGWLHKWFSPDLVAPKVVLEEQLKLMAGGLRAR